MGYISPLANLWSCHSLFFGPPSSFLEPRHHLTWIRNVNFIYQDSIVVWRLELLSFTRRSIFWRQYSDCHENCKSWTKPWIFFSSQLGLCFSINNLLILELCIWIKVVHLRPQLKRTHNYVYTYNFAVYPHILTCSQSTSIFFCLCPPFTPSLSFSTSLISNNTNSNCNNNNAALF